jgi:hypothetical protein
MVVDGLGLEPSAPKLPVPPPEALVQVETRSAQDLHFDVAQLELRRSRIRDLTGLVVKRRTEERLSVILNLYGPTNAVIQSGFSGDTITTAVDDTGNDLCEQNQRAYLNISQYGRGGSLPKDSQRRPILGTVNLTLKHPGAEAKVIAHLSGAFNCTRIYGESTLEVKPIIRNIGKEFDLPIGKFKIGDMQTPRSIEYTITATKLIEDLSLWHRQYKIRVCRGDGTRIIESGGSGGGSDGNMHYSIKLPEPLQDDAYLLVTYPTKTENLQLPFDFRNVELP